MAKNVVSALCRHLSLDSNSFASEAGSLKSLCTSILKSSKDGDTLVNNTELMKWVDFADNFLGNSDARTKALTDLNEELSRVSVVLGNGLTPTPADVIIFSTVHSSLVGISRDDRAKFPHLFRWADYIQNKVDFGDLFENILIEKAEFVIPAVVPVKKAEDSKTKKTSQETKGDNNLGADSKAKKAVDTKQKKVEESQAITEKKAPLDKAAGAKEDALSVSLLKIQIGIIRKAWKHPSADSLLVEEIDVGDAKCRQVVSGLAKFCTPEELTNRRVVLITNVKPGKLRDVMSEGLVLCASNNDHSVVEPLIAPDGAKVGEWVTFSGYDGKPEEVLNPKKRQLDKITPNLFTDDKGIATFKGVPFMTSSGPCTSSIPNATVK